MAMVRRRHRSRSHRRMVLATALVVLGCVVGWILTAKLLVDNAHPDPTTSVFFAIGALAMWAFVYDLTTDAINRALRRRSRR